jgi:hypothetical protein
MRKQRKNGLVLAGLGGIAAALAVLSTPVGLVEMIVASTGLSEALPAAAPPLGMKARLLMAAFAALMAMGLVWTMTRDTGTRDMGTRDMGIRDAGRADRKPEREEQRRSKGVQGARKMGFALSKLTALARSRTSSSVTPGAPILRRADAHPDAPARAPIFASRDFSGLDIFARTEPGRRELVVNAEPERDPIVPATGLEMPSAPMPFAEQELPTPAVLRSAPLPVDPTPVFTRQRADAGPVAPRQAAPAFEPRPLPAAPAARAEALSIPELTERLAVADAMPVIANMPVARAVPVREAPASDVDEALRAALGTLRTMTARAR